jgi:MarR family transcriptional regulator for hemolysin
MAATAPADIPNLSCLLSLASHALTTELTAGLSAVGMTPRAHAVLSSALAGELTQTQLAEQCDLDKTTMVVTVDELEAAGLAERRPAPTDRRARIIAVTPAGRKALAEAQRIVDRIQTDVLGALPAKERGPFVASLQRLVAGRLSEPVACDRIVRRPSQRAS